jgi:hypothetical protein
MNSFERKETDIAAVTGANGVSAGISQGDIKWTAMLSIIAWKDLGTQKILKERKTIVWPVDDKELAEYRSLINSNSIIRLLIKDIGDKFSLIRVISTDYDDDDLNHILNEALKPVYYDDDLLGRFTLDRRIETFTSPVIWAGEKGTLYFDYDKDESEMKLSLQTAHTLFEGQYLWSAKIKAYAAKELVDLANDWLMENEAEITEEMFVNRINFDSMSVEPNGSFEIFYFDGDIFAGHSIIVNGNINGEFTSAEIGG